MESQRPVLKLIPSKLDRALDKLCILGLIILWIFTITEYLKLPEVIATHFNTAGEADNHGSKTTLFILPVIITVVVPGMTLLNKYPHIFNYTQKITEENAVQQYTIATRLTRTIKLIITVFALFLMFEITRSATSNSSKLQWWAIPIFMFSMIIPVIISLYWFKNGKKKHNG